MEIDIWAVDIEGFKQKQNVIEELMFKIENYKEISTKKSIA